MNIRYALLVDAGYLIAGGSALVLGNISRSELECDVGGVVSMLLDVCETHLAEREEQHALLRTYWYDAQARNTPTREHLAVEQLPNVKLRLGQLVKRDGGYTQKGVDSRLVLDLSTLSLRGAASTIFLMAGDEDLVEGVLAAQDAGARVILLTVKSDRTTVSRLLAIEADEVLEVSHGELQPFFARPMSIVESTDVIAHTHAAEAINDGAGKNAEAAMQGSASLSPLDPDRREPAHLDSRTSVRLEAVGAEVAKQCLNELVEEEIATILFSKPGVNTSLRARLIGAASSKGFDVSAVGARQRLIQGFWNELAKS